ncbi:MAG: MSMEG_0570 family nitrogen starvation response protein [Cyanobacteria bacterium P01_A01_bin.105]
MPEIHFQIQWPNGQRETCYSPSLIVQDYFEAGTSYTITEFLRRSRESLQIASDRVQAKYGFPCGRALGQLQKIETTAQPFLDKPDDEVTVIGFEPQ